MSLDYQLEDTLYLPFTTRAFGTGIPTALVSGVVDIYEDVTATPIITAETLTVSLNGHAGFNMITITATAATGFEAGKSYTAILDAGTVDSVSVIGEVVAHFTLDKSAAAKDLANGTDGLSALKALIDALNDIAAADVLNVALSTVQTQGTAGAALTMMAYAGPFGPGVYIDDGAANTNTVLGTDGTIENPVSTIAAATTIASNLGVQIFYLINDTVITLVQAYEGYTFVGFGLSNKVTLGSQDVDNSEFCNLILTGTQGGTGQLYAHHCSLTALVSAELIASSCWLTGNITLRAATTHIFKNCCSAIAGDPTPDLTFPGSGTTSVNFRHYSGGLTVKSGTANDTISFEGDGQLIVDASCTSITVRPRGNFKLTDNGTTTDIELEAVPNLTNIRSEVNTALDTSISELGVGVPAATPSIRTGLMLLYMALRNKLDVPTSGTDTLEIHNDAGTRIAQKLLTDAGGDYSEAKMTSGA